MELSIITIALLYYPLQWNYLGILHFRDSGLKKPDPIIRGSMVGLDENIRQHVAFE